MCIRFVAMIVVYAMSTFVQATENKFVLKGDGRAADITSVEKSVSPDQDLAITITGNSRYKIQSKGKLSLYNKKRQKIKEIQFTLQPGEVESWEFPAEQEVQHIGLGVYGKGELEVVMQQGSQAADRVTAETVPAITKPAPSDSVTSAKSSATATGSFQALLKQAEKAYVGGNKLESVEKLKQAVLDIWDEVPLTVKNVRLVEDTKTYVTRKNNIFGSGEKMHFNSQIFGYKLKPVGGGYAIDITTDVYFLREGEILVGQQDFGKFEIISPLPNTEFRLDLTYWLTDAPPGDYKVQTVVHDQNSGQSTKFTTQIKMK